MREAKYILEQEGSIPTGNVTVTTAGDLKCKNIIHAVGPNPNCPS
jgi:O-acetyl-ADP-ribose deacetylase (regulator of RNase III)